MLPRVLLTAASLTVAAAAALLIDCASAAVTILGGDPLDICATASSLGLTGDIWVGVGLGIFAALSLVLTWIPSLRPGERRRRLSPTRTLNRNLARIPEVGDGAPPPEEPTPHEARLASFHRRFEAVEASLESETASLETIEKWVGLLCEANEMHNGGDLATADFKTINTRLLDLYTPSEAVSA